MIRQWKIDFHENHHQLSINLLEWNLIEFFLFLACAAGEYQENATTCLACKEGSYSSSGAAECTLCAVGNFAQGTGNSKCTSCSAGSYTNETGQSECKKCEKGQFQDRVGQTMCKACSEGQYSNVTGATNCTECLAGHYSKAGATACTGKTE